MLFLKQCPENKLSASNFMNVIAPNSITYFDLQIPIPRHCSKLFGPSWTRIDYALQCAQQSFAVAVCI